MSIVAQTDTPAQVLAGLGAAIDQATALSAVELEGLGPAGLVEFAQRHRATHCGQGRTHPRHWCCSG